MLPVELRKTTEGEIRTMVGIAVTTIGMCAKVIVDLPQTIEDVNVMATIEDVNVMTTIVDVEVIVMKIFEDGKEILIALDVNFVMLVLGVAVP